jgi:CubicO group peptidase (beta-lactamase class C family)
MGVSVSLDHQAVERLAARVRDEVDSGRSTAAQFALGLHGEIVAHGSVGVDDDTRFVIFSATKTIVATALLPHLADRSVELTAPVARYLPGFGANGKADVTVLQLLTMQGGFPQAPIGPDRWGTSDGRRQQFAEWTLDWPAGSRTEYHPIAAHWVIAELIETLSGRPYADVIHERVVAPAGATRLLGAPTGSVATVRTAGEVPTDRAALAAVFGRDDLVPDTTVTPDALLSLNHPLVQAAAIPGGGGIARAVDVALVYQHLLHNRDRVLPPAWLADATGTIRNGSLNVSDGTPANRTITGQIAGSDGYHAHRWFPPLSRAFGHHGAGGQLCWLEPTTGLSFCFLHDTLQLDPRADFLRARELNALVVDCVRS